MYYLFEDSTITCKWCESVMTHIIKDDPNNVILKFCPACDFWPPGLKDLVRKRDEEV